MLETNPVAEWGQYDQHLKIGGVKITIRRLAAGPDGLFHDAYLTGGPGGEKDWRGELTFPQDTVLRRW